MSEIIDEVVVLAPCVPATPTPRRTLEYLAQHLGAARDLYALLPRLEYLGVVVRYRARIDEYVRHELVYVLRFVSYNYRNVAFFKMLYVRGLDGVAAARPCSLSGRSSRASPLMPAPPMPIRWMLLFLRFTSLFSIFATSPFAYTAGKSKLHRFSQIAPPRPRKSPALS